MGGNQCTLICIDEFERLEELFPGNRRELLQLMGLLRATIQHRRKVRLLVSGVAPFDELGQVWNDHFINVREITVGHLDRQTTIELLTQPRPDFPATAVSMSVADRIFQRTGGQPYLVQLFGSLLVRYLNEEERSIARLEDLARVEEDVLTQGAYYFRHTYEASPPEGRKGLEQLASGETPQLSARTRRWMRRRWLITDDDRLQIPVLGTFVLDEMAQ
jgi:hypothetical protein